MEISTGPRLLLADRIWIVVALLHRESPDREDFSTEEIRSKMRESGLSADAKPSSVAAHLKEHLVANVPPSSSRYRMLFETRPGRLRLFRPGDSTDPGRIQKLRPSKHVPKRDEVPPQYHPLLDWYEEWSNRSSAGGKMKWEDDPLIRLIGSGRHIWADEHADEYVENLRREDI
jgi:hypothetical protein